MAEPGETSPATTAPATGQTSAGATGGTNRAVVKDRAFIANEELRNATHEGRPGWKVSVRLTSYRSLPLSCIEGMQLAIDGEPVDPGEIVFTLNNYSHKLADLAGLSHVWWFILDYAELFVPREQPLSPGDHDVEGTLITVEPYMTAGRFSSYNSSSKRLTLEQEPGGSEVQL